MSASKTPGIRQHETGITLDECTRDQEGLDRSRYIGINCEISNINLATAMRKQIAVLVLAAGTCLGLANGLTVPAMSAPQDDKI
jgi:hypothetical protein